MSEKRGSLLTAATFFLPFFLLLGIFAALGLAPFGDRSLLVSDAQGQYLSYFALYQDLFAGKADWFYSFGKLLGGSLSGLFAYYLASPFNLILLLFPKEQIPLAVDWMILLKMSACGLTMGLYLRRCFGLRPESLVLTTAYALCGYNNAYAWCVMWLDAAVLLPLVALGIERLWREDRPLLYILSLGGAIVCCFYTGYMLCLFSVLYYLARVFSNTPSLRRLSWKKPARYALASLLAGGVSAGMLVPGFLALSGGVPVTPYLSVARYTYPAALRILRLLLPGAADPDRLVLPVLLGCAALFVLLIAGVCFAYRRRGLRAGLAAFALCLGCFVLWYVLVERPVCRELGFSERRVLAKLLLGCVPFWEFYNGSPNLYAGSLALLLALSFFFNRAIPGRERASGLGLLLALLASACFYLPNLVWHGFEQNNCFNYRWSFVFIFVLLTLAARSLEKREGLRPAALLLPGAAAGAILLFAALRPLWFQENWMLLVSAAFLCAELVLLLCWRRGSGLAGRLLCLAGLAALCLTTGLSFRGQSEHARSVGSLKNSIATEQARIDRAKTDDGDFTRIRKSGTVVNYNDPMLFGYAGLVHFSSAEKLSTIRFLSRVGLSISPEYWANGDRGESRAADALLGVGRYLGKNGPAGYRERSEGVWENPNALPLAFLADSGAGGELALDSEVCRNLNRVFSRLTGAEQLIFLPAASDGLSLTVESEEPLYLQIWSEAVAGCTLRRNGETETVFSDLYCPEALCLGVFEPGDRLEIEPNGEGKIPPAPANVFFYEDSAALARCTEALKAEACETKILRASHIEIRTAADEEKLLVLTIPADEGWAVRVDGAPAAPETALGLLTALRLAPGEHEISLRFTPVGLVPGLAVTALSLAAAAVWALSLKKKRRSAAADGRL